MKYILHFSMLLLFVLFRQSQAISQKTPLDSILKAEMQQLHLPGLAALVIDSNRIVWSGYYGFQNIEQSAPVTRQTSFMIASSSKTITAAALMQLYAKKKFHLDDNINKYLDFKIVNPSFPKVPITFRQLLRHRSSICDNTDYLSQYWDVNKGDPTIPLGTFLKNYLSVNGTHYDKEKNFTKKAPNAEFQYSNIGMALIGYLVERIGGQPFDKFCNSQIFQPLSMDHTAWFLRDLDSGDIAMPYAYSASLNKYIAIGHGGYPDYPAGQLRSTAEDMAKFLAAWNNDGRINNIRVFDSTAIQTLTPSDFDLGFHTWFLYGTAKGDILYSHSGRDNGVSSFILYDPRSKRGVVLLTNGVIRPRQRFREIIEPLFYY